MTWVVSEAAVGNKGFPTLAPPRIASTFDCALSDLPLILAPMTWMLCNTFNQRTMPLQFEKIDPDSLADRQDAHWRT